MSNSFAALASDDVQDLDNIPPNDKETSKEKQDRIPPQSREKLSEKSTHHSKTMTQA